MFGNKESTINDWGGEQLKTRKASMVIDLNNSCHLGGFSLATTLSPCPMYSSLNLLLFIEVVIFFSVADTVITRLLRREVVASSELLAVNIAVQGLERQLILFFVLDVRWQGLGEIAVTSTVGSLSPCKPLPRRCGNSWTTSALSLEPLPRCCW
jgi:hypothetical protein